MVTLLRTALEDSAHDTLPKAARFTYLVRASLTTCFGTVEVEHYCTNTPYVCIGPSSRAGD